MPNQLNMADIHAILALHRKGWSQRRIARELGLNRETVARYLAPKPAIVHTGSEADATPKPAIVHMGSDGDLAPKPAIVHIGSDADSDSLVVGMADLATLTEVFPLGAGGRQSECHPFRDLIQARLDQGLSAQRIWQDLKAEHGFTHSYYSVLRFAAKLRPNHELPFRRIESAPGEQAQIDFGTGAPIVADGKRQRTHVFRIVLSHSRKAYSEAVARQTTDAFLACLENAFAYFGGAPKTLVVDNLKAAVAKADWFDPELNPKVTAFCQHYGTVMLPTKPYTPRHKGKVERGIDYVQENALKGRTFASLEEQNRFLLEWERHTADTRVHGTTRKQVGALFDAVEKPALMSLPAERFPQFKEARRTVHRDGHVEVDKAYYSVPPEHLGRVVWVRWDGRLVRVFNQRFELIATHARHLPGSFSTLDAHLHSAKISKVEGDAKQLLARAVQLGAGIGQWAKAMLQERGLHGIRPLLGLLALAKRLPLAALEYACAAAHRHGAYRLRNVRQLAQRLRDQQAEAIAPFAASHSLIRPLAEYGQFVQRFATDAVLGAGEPEAPVSPAPKPPPPPSLSSVPLSPDGAGDPDQTTTAQPFPFPTSE